MKYYKTNNGIRAIGELTDLDGDQSKLVQKDWIEISYDEMMTITNPPKTDEEMEKERIQNIYSQIDILESKTYRPLREQLVGTEEEKLEASIILSNLNEQIKELRSQL